MKTERCTAPHQPNDFRHFLISLLLFFGVLVLTGCTGLVSGNSSNSTGTPPALTISAPASGNVTSTGVTFSWLTNLPATSQVQYGISASYGSSTTLDSTMVTSHQQSVSGLTPATLYHYRFVSTDANNDTATSSDLTFTTAAGTTQPSISITSPAAGAGITGITNVVASASSSVGIANVQFKVDGANSGVTVTTAPYTLALDTTLLSNANHILTAVATDTAGASMTSAGIAVKVSNSPADTTPPTVSMTAPLNGASVSGTVSVTASASDNVGVVSLQFQLDGANLGSVETAPPFTFSWDSTKSSNASHVLRAIAKDAAGNTGTSASVTITVNNVAPDTTPPSVPTGLAATAISSSQINLSWNASTDNVGVTGYKISRGGSQIGTSSTTTYQDTTLSAATTYTYTVAAFDAAGNTSAQSSSASATTNAISFQLSGSITPAASGSGATVTLSGAAAKTTTADSSGNFSFTGLGNGTYTVTPAKAGFSFSPGSQTSTVNGANVTGVTFTATAQTYSISGTISPASSGSGVTVNLSGVISKSATADVNGNYSFTGLTNGNYSVAPSKTGVSFGPSSQPVTISNANVIGVNFTASVQSLSISGSISPAANGSGATVTLTGTSTASTTADASGNFTFTGLINGNYTVVASKAGYTLSPASQPVFLSGTNATGVNFTATAQTFSLSGTVGPSAIGAGITINLGGASSGTTTTDSSGNYVFTGLVNGSYTITPSKTGYTFAPTSQSATVSGANVTGMNFTATAPTFTISGSISPATSGSGALLTLSGPSNATATADNSGNFSFSGLLNGSYTVTPSKTGFAFSPVSLQAVINGANVAALAFTATPSSQNVIFFDDFTTTPLGSAWTALNRAGDASGNEQQCNIPGDVSVSNSNMLIVSKVQSMTCQTSTTPAQTYGYTSGAVQWTSFNFTYGTIEYRLQLPSAGQGLRPVIWLLGSNCQQTNIKTADNVSPCNWDFPGSEEIDITEMIGSYYFSINQALHASSLDYGCVPNVDVSTGFHTYQLVWKPGSLTWNVDGVATCTVNNSNVPSTPMFLIVETTVGGSGGTISNSTLPQTMYLDYVKVTQP